MHGRGIHRVVDLQLHEQHGHKLVDDGTNETSSHRRARLHVRTACGDRHQARENAVAQPAHVILPGDEVAQGEDSDASDSCRERGVHGNHRCLCSCLRVVHRQGRAWVEAVPAKPQDEGSQNHERKRVRLKLLCTIRIETAISRAKYAGASESGNPSTQVDNTTASKVHESSAERANLPVHPSIAPSPGHHHRVDKGSHDKGKYCKAGTLHTLGDTATDNCGSSCAECPLEEPSDHVVRRSRGRGDSSGGLDDHSFS
mmetsp:Transcript_30970/g.49745  ORF Transcript_30970/g.49745 Transcript_30970/m.49745 type:complete len:257 (+) Transcript_30970:423-1193(+)